MRLAGSAGRSLGDALCWRSPEWQVGLGPLHLFPGQPSTSLMASNNRDQFSPVLEAKTHPHPPPQVCGGSSLPFQVPGPGALRQVSPVSACVCLHTAFFSASLTSPSPLPPGHWSPHMGPAKPRMASWRTLKSTMPAKPSAPEEPTHRHWAKDWACLSGPVTHWHLWARTLRPRRLLPPQPTAAGRQVAESRCGFSLAPASRVLSQGLTRRRRAVPRPPTLSGPRWPTAGVLPLPGPG